MTDRRDSESTPEQVRPKLEKEKLRDLDLDHEAAEGVRGGAAVGTGYGCNQAGNQTGGCNS